ncbi:MAG: hypothetical protein ACREMK_03120 [Gemmatimonadota bacterium]
MTPIPGDFVIPPWDRSKLEEKLQNTEGLERELLKASEWSFRIAQFLKQAPISGPSVGWYALWAKHFLLLSAVRSALREESSLLLDLLNRPLFELELHIGTIGNPRWRGGDPESRDFADIPVDEPPEEIRDRLKAYCAWCLEEDVLLLENRLEPGMLDMLFDYRWQRELVRAMGPYREHHERELGEIEIVSDAEAKLDRERYEKALDARRAMTERLIKDLDLSEWVDRIRKQRKKRTYLPFTDLFESSQGSSKSAGGVKGKLRSMGMPWASLTYSKDSMLLHQSSLLQVIQLSENGVSIRVPRGNDFESQASHATRSIKRGLMLMEGVWKRGFPRRSYS